MLLDVLLNRVSIIEGKFFNRVQLQKNQIQKWEFVVELGFVEYFWVFIRKNVRIGIIYTYINLRRSYMLPSINPIINYDMFHLYYVILYF